MKRPQLFLLHFAGGNCYSFQFLTPLLRDFEVIPLELPGRGRRMGEDLLTDFDAAADNLFQQLLPRVTSDRFCIYGHSMGAYLALRLSNMLEKAGKNPLHVIVSGNAGPGVEDEGKTKRYLLEKDEFKEELKTIGGVPDELLADEELFGFFEPVLRADFEISEENRMINEPPVNAPLYAMMGSEEEDVEKIENWGKYTRSAFRYEVLDGNHFFIHKHPQRIAAILKDCCKTASAVQHQ